MARPHTRRRVGNNGDAGVEAPPLNRKPSSRDKRRSISLLGRSTFVYPWRPGRINPASITSSRGVLEMYEGYFFNPAVRFSTSGRTNRVRPETCAQRQHKEDRV
jgi:hypothetical protein